jgi:hypothetical protein
MTNKDDSGQESDTNASIESDTSERSDPVTPLARSQMAYKAELLELLAHHRGKWVAYADGDRLRLGNSQVELYRHCLSDLGLTHDRFIVRRIMPESSPQIEYTPR